MIRIARNRIRSQSVKRWTSHLFVQAPRNVVIGNNCHRTLYGAPVATVSATENFTSSPSFSWGISGIFLLAAIGATASSLTVSACEEAAKPSINAEPSTEPSTTDPSTSSEQEEEEDPYENLPEEDEETDCAMCRTFRVGPCGPSWRKLERCFKDHEKEENGATKCMRYFQAHSDCLMEYSNLYQLISLELKQDLVRDAKRSVTAAERQKWKPEIDWHNYKVFYAETGPSFRQTIPVVIDEGEDPLQIPLWKRLPPDMEPVLVTVTANLPRMKQDFFLQAAFAVDQDGKVMGFTFSKEYRERIEQAEKNAAGEKGEASKEEKEGETKSESTPSSEDGDGDKAPKSDKEQSDTFAFDFYLLPGHTKDVRVSALYAEDPITASPDKDILDAFLMESPRMPLAKVVAKKKTKKKTEKKKMTKKTSTS